jgi:hypothetical protein
MKKLLIVILTLFSVQAFAQYPAIQTIGSDSTVVKSKGGLQGRIINWAYPDTTTANRERISHYPGSQIFVKNLIYLRDSTATKWLVSEKGTSNISILNDSTLIISNLSGSDTFHTTVLISNWTVLSDTTIQVCGTGGCDTVYTSPTVFAKPYVDSVIIHNGVSLDTLYYYVNGNAIVGGYIGGRYYNKDEIDSIFTVTLQNYYTQTQIDSINTVNGVTNESNHIISGGVVTYSGTGLTYYVSACIYMIGGTVYYSPQATITLAAADATNPRIDLFAVDTLSEAIKITGTAASVPLTPQINPASQLALTTGITLPPNATTPTGTSSTLIYDENVEWTTGGTATVNFNNTTNPYHGTKDASVSYTKNQTLTFTGTTQTVNGQVLRAFIRLNNSNYNFQFQFFNGTTAVSNPLALNGFGFNPTLYDSYQNVSIPLTSFMWRTNIFDKLVITMTGKGNQNPGTYYIDYISLESGTPIINPPTDYSNKVDSVIARNDSLFYVIKGIYYYTGSITSTENSPLNNGLISTGGISLVDSTVTINDTIRWVYNGVKYQQNTPASFIINSADSGYYRKDLIYADSTGLHLLAGEKDTAFGVAPALPKNSIMVTTVDVYGKQIATPIPTIIGTLPTLQQVTDQGNSTTNPIFINSSNIQTPLRIITDRNRSNYLYFKNKSSDGWANTGFLFKNDVPDDPNNEHTGHFLQMYMGSTNSSFSKDGGLIRSNGTGGIKVALDSGKFILGTGSPSLGNYTSRFEMGTDGNLSFLNYKNNITLDSVLSTDQNGKVILKKVAVGDIDVLQVADSSAADIKKLDGTHKYIVVLGEDGSSTGVSSGNGIQTIQAGTGVTIDNTDPSNPIISATGGTGSTYTASNGLTMSGSDVQLGGILLNNTTINTNTYNTIFSGANSDYGNGVVSVKNSANGFTLYAESTGSGSPAIYGVANDAGSTGVSGYSTNGIGIGANSQSGTALYVTTSGGLPVFIDANYASNSSINNAIKIFAETGNPTDAQSGMGASISFNLSDNTSGSEEVNSIISKWADISSKTSEFSITGIDNAVAKTLIRLKGNGKIVLSQAPPQYTDNAAAVAAGEEVGTIFTTNGEDLKIVH